MALRFEITDADTPYEIFVRELVAMDGQDNSEILLIDGRGCPTDPTIMQRVIQVSQSVSPSVNVHTLPSCTLYVTSLSCPST